MGKIETIQEVTGVKLSLTLEEAQGLFELLFRGVGSGTLNSLELVDVLAALRGIGVVAEVGTERRYFKESAQLED